MDDGTAAAGRGQVALVRGPSAVFPRGGVWIFSVWGAIAFAALAAAGHGLPFDLVALAACGFGAVVPAMVFRRAVSPAFAVDSGGITLGRATATARGQRLGWDEISRLTISPNRHGLLLRILVSSEAAAASPLRRLAGLVLFSLPMGARKSTPALLTVLPDPPRYEVPLARITADQLQSMLTGAAPATIPVEVLP